jgi:hypothetical protein
MQLRAKILPLCPVHYFPMNAREANTEYLCAEIGCTFGWRFDRGYFELRDGKVQYPPNAYELLKPALVAEHGYLYVAFVEGLPGRVRKRRTWVCAVKGCPNTIVDEFLNL